MEGTCESCGAESADLLVVRRVYVTPADWDTEGRADAQPGTEAWCFPCRSMYPHLEPGDEIVDDGGWETG